MGGATWMVCTMRLVSSSAAMAVHVPKDAVPLWKPRTIRPSLRYCWIGSHTRSLHPCTAHTHTHTHKHTHTLMQHIIEAHTHMQVRHTHLSPLPDTPD